VLVTRSKFHSIFCLTLAVLLWGQLLGDDDLVIAQHVQKTFGATAPKVLKMWLTDAELKKDLRHIIGREDLPLRQRYYQIDQKRLWIVEEIGKERMITMAIVTENDAILEQKVLVYRESRGAEVAQQAYCDQFNQQTLKQNLELSHGVDGITGATLSCRAMTKMARYVLRLEQFLK
jgi:hypothetical protein